MMDQCYHRHVTTAVGRQQSEDTAPNNGSEPCEVQALQYPPAIQRYLLEGGQAEEKRRQEREGYPPGAIGMKQYLQDWEDSWDNVDGARD